jgi:predicted transcriptional regulator YheO
MTNQRLSETNIRQIFNYCLLDTITEYNSESKPIVDYKTGQGIMLCMNFNTERLNENAKTIGNFLNKIDKIEEGTEFKHFDKINGYRWTKDKVSMDCLVTLGVVSDQLLCYQQKIENKSDVKNEYPEQYAYFLKLKQR